MTIAFLHLIENFAPSSILEFNSIDEKVFNRRTNKKEVYSSQGQVERIKWKVPFEAGH